MSFHCKVIPVFVDGRAVAAVAVTGRIEPSDLGEHIMTLVPASLRDFLDRFPEAFRVTEMTLKARNEAGSMAAVVAAFDHARNLALGFTIGNDNALFPLDQRPYELKKRSMHITEFDPDDLALRRIDFCDPGQWEPESDGERLIDAQRRDRGPQFGHYSIGGAAVLTRLDKNGLATKVLKTWPDRIGRRIDPDRQPPLKGWRDRLARIRDKFDTRRR
ncbi:hypothetical protein [Croceibacterium aestuarii]|uniref:hypothetical protein n=1 Tax=Croceibacterium aestuarii TaxID=3064139 RepID=UPI00272E43C2|nr:hypothetical protein [Croceibacterium sp. D39]